MKQDTKQLRICKGCLIKCAYYDTYRVELTPESTIMKCPCAFCIVKMMCNTGCDEYTKFAMEELNRRSQDYQGVRPVIRL
jgi:hypothetical protein